jgi:diguanylate cyclase (GGDEF)-like protein
VLAFLLVTEATAVVAVVLTAAHTTIEPQDVLAFLGLLTCSVALVEVRRRVSVPQPGTAVVKDMISIWCLPIALLLPPVYGLLAPIPLLALTHLRVHTGVLYRRVFTAAAMMLAFGLAGAAFRAVAGSVRIPLSGMPSELLTWVAAVLVAAAVRWAVNVSLISVAILTTTSVGWRKLLMNKDAGTSDAVEICLGVMSTVLAAVNPILVLATIPPVLMLQRAVQYKQLVAAVRRDAKTGLLNAPAWDQEASAALVQADRDGTPLAVLLLDIDHFKRVNDTRGHLAGDHVLRAIAEALPTQLRRGDVVGRFGGEEFVVLLPNTDDREAHTIAERLRRHIANLTVPLDEDGPVPAAVVQVTVSIGVATFDHACHHSHSELLATADRALYRAKNSGRNRVCVYVNNVAAA